MYASAKASEGGGGNIRCRRPLVLLAKGAAAWLLAAGLAVASGCRDGARLEVPAIEVNGIALTGSEVEREIAFRLALVEFHKPKMSDAGLEKARRRISASVTNEIVSGLLFQSAAARRGVCANEAMTNGVLARYRRTFAPGAGGLATLTRRLAQADLATVFTNCLRRDLAREAYLAALHGDELKVGEQDVDALLGRIKRFNEVAAATNALAHAKATNLWRRVQSGEDFARLADAESEDSEKRAGGEIGECEKVDFDGIPGYWESVSKLKTGDVSPVLRTDVGLEIVKALTPLAPSENTGMPSRRLARIYVRLPMFHPEWTRGEARQELEGERRKEALKKAFDEACAGSDVLINGERRDFHPVPGAAREKVAAGTAIKDTEN